MTRKKTTSFNDLIKIMATLRAPGGCPWDREQTHSSLLRYIMEETQEVCEAVEKNDWDNLKEELGDVLLQILFHSQIARENKKFDIEGVLAELKSKLIRRHPHVFDKRRKKEVLTSSEVKRRWNIIKAKEKAGKK